MKNAEQPDASISFMLSIAIVSNNKNKYSETFIHRQIALLPADVHLLYGGYLPVMFGNDQPLALETGWRHRIFGVSEKQAATLNTKGIESYLKKNKIQAVLAQYGPSGVAMMEICRKIGIPLIVHFHGFEAYRNDILEDYGGKYPVLFETANIVCVSTDMQRQLLKLGAKPERLHLIPYGVDTNLFKPGQKKMQHPVFIACGRFVPKKAPYLTIEAFAKTLEKIPSAKLMMIGEGDLLPTCQSLADSLGISHAIDFKGVLGQMEIAELLPQALALVQHSVRSNDGDAEGLPLAILEAGACGLPVVATKHMGIADAVVEGDTGYLVAEGDTAGMSERMIYLAQNSAIASTMGFVARQHICTYYNQERYINDLWAAILNAIAGNE